MATCNDCVHDKNCQWDHMYAGDDEAYDCVDFQRPERRIKMELKETIELMSSADWKDRFVAEYLQTKIRYEKLHKLIVRREAGKLDFDTPIPLESWKEQAYHMGMYLNELEKQSVIHGIELPKVLV